MINRVILIGRLTRDPELRYTQNGTAVTTFTLAVNRRFNQEETDFINIVAWKQLAELCANHLKKGQQTAVEGRLQSRSYENKQGQKVTVIEVVADNVQFLGGKKKESNGDPFKDEGETIEINNSDLPF